MTFYIIFWSIVVFFSLISFIIMSYIMLTRGIPELKDMFRQLSDRNRGKDENL